MTTVVLDARKLSDFGIGTYLRGLIRGLAELDSETRYVLLGDTPDESWALELPPNFIWHLEHSAGYSLRELWSVSRAARRAGADLFHAPHYVLPAGLRCPAVVTVHDLIHLRFPEHRTVLERLYARVMMRRAIRRASAVLTVSETTRSEVQGRFGSLAVNVVAIPNGVDNRFREPLPSLDVEAALARFGLAPGYLLFVGNPKPHKNLSTLLAAQARLVAERGPTAPNLVLVGDSGNGVSASSTVLQLGKVAPDDLPALYRGALALVMPSLWEGFGLPAAEAMACGTPVVAANRGALPEVISDAGLLFEPTDIGALLRLLVRLLDEPALRTELARRGPERAAQFQWTRTARATLAVYRDLLAETPGDRR